MFVQVGMLEALLKAGGGALVSLGLGAQEGYLHSRSQSLNPEKNGWLRDLKNAGLTAVYGAAPYALISWESVHENPLAYCAGIISALVGNSVGKLLWRRRDYNSPLNDKELEAVGRYKRRLKWLSVIDQDEMIRVGVEEMEPYFKKLSDRKPMHIVEKLKKAVLDEVHRYELWHSDLEELVSAEEDIAIKALVPKDGELDGRIYVLENDSMKAYTMELLEAQVFSRDDSPNVPVQFKTKVVKKESRKWTIAELADEVSQEKRMVVVAGGRGVAEEKGKVALLVYRNMLAEELVRKYSHKQGEIIWTPFEGSG